MERFVNKLKHIKLKHILILILIVLFYGICLWNVLSDDKSFSENENRSLAQMPEFSFADIASGKYTEDFDSYANDQFVGRDFFVSMKTYAERLFLKKETNGIIFADDGYLIEVPDYSKKEIAAGNIQAIKDLGKLKGINITTCVVPTAFEMLKQKLPRHAYNSSVSDLQETIRSSMEDSNIKVTDVTNYLEERKKDYIYYRTDHHQTALGSYLVYSALGRSLKYTPYKEDSFDIKQLSDDFYGTTWSKTMIHSVKPDIVSSYTLKGSDLSYVIEFPAGKEKNLNSLYDTTKLETKDKYSVYLGGVHPVQVIRTNSKDQRKLAIIKDSYAHSIVPFLTNHFGEIHLIDMRYYNKNVVEYLNTNNLDDVLILYNASTFMTDPSMAKLSTYSKELIEKYSQYGAVKESEKVGDSYFDDALFIGDSLTDGLRLYSSLKEATYASGTGMTLKGVLSVPLSDGNYTLDLLKNTPYKKIYILLGINEKLTEDNISSYCEDYVHLIKTIREINPDTYIYLQSILPVTEKKSKSHRFLNNNNIPLYNEAIEKVAEENMCYYLKVNEIMMDDTGALPSNASSDGIHPSKEYYEKWIEYLKTHAISDGKASFDREKETLTEEGEKLLKIAGQIEEKVSFDEDLEMIDIDSAKAVFPVEGTGIKDMVVLSGSGATADEIAILKITPESRKKAEKLAKERIEKRKNDFRTYIPKEMPKLDKPIIKWNDDMLILVITNDHKTAEKTVNDILK